MALVHTELVVLVWYCYYGEWRWYTMHWWYCYCSEWRCIEIILVQLCEVLSLDVLSVNSFDFDKKELTFQGQMPYLNFSGTYGLNGKLASLPISGNGTYTVSFGKNMLTVTCFCNDTISVIHRHLDMTPRRLVHGHRRFGVMSQFSDYCQVRNTGTHLPNCVMSQSSRKYIAIFEAL
jgi:hypothetical protein